MLHHVSGKHEWLATDGYDTGKCAHGPLEVDPKDKKELIHSGSKAHAKLRALIFDTSILKKIEMFLNFR